MSEAGDDLKQALKGELQRTYNAISIVKANGGWKHRSRLPLTDEQVVGQEQDAIQYLLSAVASLVVARRLIAELGRDAYFEARVNEARMILEAPQGTGAR